jgi:hypothetical protein
VSESVFAAHFSGEFANLWVCGSLPKFTSG